MSSSQTIQLGIVGSCGRGGAFRSCLDAVGTIRVSVICDLKQDELEQSRQELGADHAFTDYEQMLDEAKPDAVLIATPMPLHVPHAIAALHRDIHVLSEVPAGVSIEQCQSLVAAVKKSRGIYMMAENYNYYRSNQIVKALVEQGLFGELYYAEGEYVHELKALNVQTPWRREWQTGINGVTYPTHSLGPILQWMQGDRVVSVCCAGSGHHYQDAHGRAYEIEDSCVMLCKMASGGLAKIRLDMLSNRPHAMHNYQLQGTDGCYESARAEGERDRIWLRERAAGANTWMALEDLAPEFMPQNWQTYGNLAADAGHGGGDLLVLADFVEVIQGGHPNSLGVHEAMDMTLPGLVSQQSIVESGQWMDVPDSRTW